MKMDTSSEPATGSKRTRRDVSPEEQHGALAKRQRLNLKLEDADKYMPPGIGCSDHEDSDSDDSEDEDSEEEEDSEEDYFEEEEFDEDGTEEDDEDDSYNLRHLYANDSGIEDNVEEEGEELDSNFGEGYTADDVLTEVDRLHFRGVHFEDDEPQINNDVEDEIGITLAFDEDIRS